jgi:hypothetical protein
MNAQPFLRLPCKHCAVEKTRPQSVCSCVKEEKSTGKKCLWGWRKATLMFHPACTEKLKSTEPVGEEEDASIASLLLTRVFANRADLTLVYHVFSIAIYAPIAF